MFSVFWNFQKIAANAAAATEVPTPEKIKNVFLNLTFFVYSIMSEIDLLLFPEFVSNDCQEEAEKDF